MKKMSREKINAAVSAKKLTPDPVVLPSKPKAKDPMPGLMEDLIAALKSNSARHDPVSYELVVKRNDRGLIDKIIMNPVSK